MRRHKDGEVMKGKKQPTFTEIKLYDALNRLTSELYADGPTRAGEEKAFRALARFQRLYGNRSDGSWESSK